METITPHKLNFGPQKPHRVDRSHHARLDLFIVVVASVSTKKKTLDRN